MKPLSPLPIDALLPEIVDTVRKSPITLLEAEPGAGKTTRVPAALVDAGLGSVFVLEPRRLAARLAARRVASELGEAVGETVGYQVRFEEVSSVRTRLWYVTEGVLTRRLLGNAQMTKSVVILDEFHERHLETDLAFALLRRMQKAERGLKVMLMSATLSASDLSERLGGVPMVRSPGRAFPVSVRYTPHSAAPLEEHTAQAVETALRDTKGHVLVFLPGAAEIRKTIAACAYLERRESVVLLPLHGELSPEQQDEAVSPSLRRKVICSTNVAESSITIEGVSAVVDSGLARVLTHSPWSGISRLTVERVSQSSAIQRTGRAGRTGPGLAIRLYPESDFVRRPAHLAPEILRSDLTQFTLMLAANGLGWEDLAWLDMPPEELRTQARELLVELGALESTGGVTELGSVMGGMPLHPRLARLAFEAGRRGVGRAGAELAARLSEGRIRMEQEHRENYLSDVDALFATELRFESRRLMDQILRMARRSLFTAAPDALDKCVATAFPDRIARRRGETLLLANGATARLDSASAVRTEFLAAVEIDERRDAGSVRSGVVRLASPIEPDWLLELFPDAISVREQMDWNRETERVEEVQSILYKALVVDETRTHPTNGSKASELLAKKARESGLSRFVDLEVSEAFFNRLRFAAEHGLEMPTEDELLDEAFTELAQGLTSLKELQTAARDNALLGLMEARLPMRAMEEMAPSSVVLPSGRRARIEYHAGGPPSVSSRLQDFFGMAETPVVARGRVPVVVQLLAPNKRPVQVTSDLSSFWKNLYPQVRKELSRRYPRHSWPENPMQVS